MSLPYPATLNTIFYHQLLYPFGGVCEIDNSSPFYCYVALGPKASVSDIMSQNVAVISPYQKRAFSVNVHNTTPSLSIVPTDKPFAFPRAIGGSQAVIRVSEYSNPKVFFNSPTFDGLAADYIIIAGGLIEANQQGLYARNPTGGEVLAVNLDANHAWDGVTMQPGDVMIGRGANSLYWNDAAGTLSINSGSIVRAVSTDVVFGSSGLGAIWSAGSVRLSDGRTITISSGSLAAFGAGVQYLTIDPGGALSQPFDVFAWDDLPDGYLVIAVVVSDGVHPVSVIVSLGGTLISGGQIVTGSIVTGNLAATAIDGMTITGATIRTDSGSVPEVKIDSGGISILADANDFVQWKSRAGDLVCSMRGGRIGALNTMTFLTGNTGDSGSLTIGVRRSGSSALRGSLQFITVDGSPTICTMFCDRIVLQTQTGGGLAEYADNAAAVSAGLTDGSIYRTGDVVKSVHI